MKLSGEHHFDSPREDVWEALLESEVLSCCLPGFEKLERVGEGEYEGALNIRVGPVQGQFRGRLSLSDLEPPRRYNMMIKGQGPPGFVNGKGWVELEEEEGATLLRYEMDTQVGGKIAGVGQRLLDSSAKALSSQALIELGNIIQARSNSAAEGAAVVAPAAPTQAAFAAKVAKGVAADLVPPERRPLLWTVILLAGVALIVLALRACGS